MQKSGEWVPGNYNQPSIEDSIKWRLQNQSCAKDIYNRFHTIKKEIRNVILPRLKDHRKLDGSLPSGADLEKAMLDVKEAYYQTAATPREKRLAAKAPATWTSTTWAVFLKYGPQNEDGGNPVFWFVEANPGCTNRASSNKKRKAEMEAAVPPTMPPDDVAKPPPVPTGTQELQAQLMLLSAWQRQMAQQGAAPLPLPPPPPAAQDPQLSVLSTLLQPQPQKTVAMAPAPSQQSDPRQLVLQALHQEIYAVAAMLRETEDKGAKAELMDELKELREKARRLREAAAAMMPISSSVPQTAVATGAAISRSPMVEVIQSPAGSSNAIERVTINISFKEAQP